MLKSALAMAGALAFLGALEAVAQAGCGCCGGAAAASATSVPAASVPPPPAPTAQASLPGGARRFSIAPSEPPSAVLALPPGDYRGLPPIFRYDYDPATYSRAAFIREGQIMYTFGLRPAANKAQGTY